MQSESKLPEILKRNESEILSEWIDYQRAAGTARPGAMKESELKSQSAEFISIFSRAVQKGGLDLSHGAWDEVRDFLAQISSSRARLGYSPSETATFILSFKQPLFARLRSGKGGGGAEAEEMWQLSLVLDRLGLIVTEEYQKSREEVIHRQQQELLELSTPVVRLWQGVLALPLIGTLDSARTQVVMENLLQEIVRTGAEIAIIDITGVPTVDTLVAQHLLKTVAAARLMGADCIISGIRPQIAQTIVHLGVELNDVVTKATLADAFLVALRRSGLAVSAAGGER